MIYLLSLLGIIFDRPGSYSLQLNPGQYTFKCYGAQGGNAFYDGNFISYGGKGAFVSGTLTIKRTNMTFYLIVGGQGSSFSKGLNNGGYNGGGKSVYTSRNMAKHFSGGGGGASDIRITHNSIKSRIMVAAGGSGAAYSSQGAPGGTTHCMKAINNSVYAEYISNGNMDGIGGDGFSSEFIAGSGGGGGYFGGPSSDDFGRNKSTSYKSVAKSGSSYVSGYPGMPKYANISFDNIEMKSGIDANYTGDGKIEIETVFECAPNCSICTSGTKCTKCLDDYFLFGNGEKCVSDCPDGFYGANGVCSKCSSVCSKCTSSEICTECSDGYYLYENKCKKCPNDYNHKQCKSTKQIKSITCPDNTVKDGNVCVKCNNCAFYTSPKYYSVNLKAGRYIVYCYGAQGGRGYTNSELSSIGGLGAYAKGTMDVTGTGTQFFLYVGGQGKSGKSGPNEGGFNGGGSGGRDKGIYGGDASGGGGGATDIRIGGNSIGNRIIVAAGGSGGAYKCVGAPGGDLTGYRQKPNNVPIKSDSVNQFSGNQNGEGGKGVDNSYTPGSGGGGGWRGGVSSNDWAFKEESSYMAVAHSGSSYISGHTGCIQNNLMVFTNTNMIAGVNEKDGQIVIDTLFECISYCSSCVSATSCTKCFPNYYLFNNNKECVSSCPSGYAGIDGRCEKCVHPCKECESEATSCTICIDDYFLLGRKCMNPCPPGYVGLNKICEPCPKKCSNCETSPRICLICMDGYYLHNNECLSKCPSGYFVIDGECKICDESCFECENTSTTCIACNESNFLLDNSCVEKCPNNYVPMEGQCKECLPQCTRCEINQTTCTSCDNNYYLSGSDCLSECPPGKMAKDKTPPNNICIDCNQTCATCETTVDNCLTCNEGMYLYNNKCYSECNILNDGIHFYGKNNVNQSCDECGYKCIDCSSDSSICNKCNESFELREGECYAYPTNLFTDSKEFTPSSEYSPSVRFSSSGQFTQSFKFSKSSDFSQSKLFTESSPFTFSSKFAPSSPFTYSSLFTLTTKFSSSSSFTETSPFSKTRDFSQSSLLTESSFFTLSSMFAPSSPFTHSSLFTLTTKFTSSSSFTETSPFSESNVFSQSSIFTESIIIFTPSSPFSESSLFSKTRDFSQSSLLTKSSFFTLSSMFAPSSPFTHSSLFTLTTKFTSSSSFTESSPFSGSNDFSQSMSFIKQFVSHSQHSKYNDFSLSSQYTEFQDIKSSSSYFEQSHHHSSFQFSENSASKASTISTFSSYFSYIQQSKSVQNSFSGLFESFGPIKSSGMIDSYSSSLQNILFSRSLLTSNDFVNSIKPNVQTVFSGIIRGGIQDKKKKNNTPIIAGVVAGIIFLIISAAILIIFLLKKKKNDNENIEPQMKSETEEQKVQSSRTPLHSDEESTDLDLNFWL